MNHNTLICHRCNLTFFNRKELREHIRMSHVMRHYCLFCPKDYDELMYRKNNYNELQYQCIVCKKNFWTSKKLYKHLRKHKNIFKCLFCVARFNAKGSLRWHLINKHFLKPCLWLPSLENYNHFKNLIVEGKRKYLSISSIEIISLVLNYIILILYL